MLSTAWTARVRTGVAAVAIGASLGVFGAAPANAITYNLDVNYCSTSCNLAAGHVDVTEGTGVLAGDLVFAVTLFKISNVQTLFRNNSSASFTFDLQSAITGASIFNIAGNGPYTWTPVYGVTNTGAAPGPWTAGLTYDANPGGNGGHKDVNGFALTFDVSADTALTLASLAQSTDNNGKKIWFSADVSQNGNTGFVGADITCDANCTSGGPPLATPLPSALWLFGTVLAGGAGFGRWRQKQKAALSLAASK